MPTVSILGCGWLGLPLGQRLTSLRYTVKGTTTTPSKLSVLKASNIIPYLLTCNPSVEGEHVADFFQADALFVNIPFRRDLKDPQFYVEQQQAVAAQAAGAGIRVVIFASSTAVYPLNNQYARESDRIVSTEARINALLEAEQVFLNDKRFNTIVIRFAGLYGPGRDIGGFLKTGRIAAKDGNAPVNLIHLDDCIGIIEAVLKTAMEGGIINACSDDHPLRNDLYARAAAKAGIDLPHLNEKDRPSFKIIDNSRLKKLLNYRFKYPSPVDWLNERV